MTFSPGEHSIEDFDLERERERERERVIYMYCLSTGFGSCSKINNIIIQLQSGKGNPPAPK